VNSVTDSHQRLHICCCCCCWGCVGTGVVAPGIPVGDLFVAMESWEEPERIRASMDVILEIEAEAAKGVQGKDGLMELLHM